MKKRVFNFIVIALFILVSIYVGYVFSLTVPVKCIDLVLDVPEDFETKIYTTKIAFDDDKRLASKVDIVSDVDNILDNLPFGVLNILEPYTIVITPKNIVSVNRLLNPSEMFSNYDMFKAVVNYEKNVICLDANNLSYRDSIYHEIGHAVDNSLGFISESSEFQSIYEREVANFRSNISEYRYTRDKHGVPVREADWFTVVENPTEYFAESFNAYFLQRDILKESCPETYEYLDELFSDME